VGTLLPFLVPAKFTKLPNNRACHILDPKCNSLIFFPDSTAKKRYWAASWTPLNKAKNAIKIKLRPKKIRLQNSTTRNSKILGSCVTHHVIQSPY
jgi:hypothetical protein